MNSFSVLIPLLLSSLLGLTGYLKDMREDNIGGRKNALLGGARTLFLISLSGLISGAVFMQGLPVFSFLFSLSVVTFVIVFYTVTANKDQNSSFSDELSAIIAHALSFLWVTNILPQAVLLAAFVGTIFILEQRDALVSLGKKVSTREASEIVGYLAIALIILPFLPNVTYSLSELGFHPEMFGLTGEKLHDIVTLGLLNPYKIWFIVVFVSGIDIVGFLLKRIVTDNGNGTSDVLPALIGGFVSSTSTTIGLAVRSLKEKRATTLAAGAVLANVTSFFQLFILLAPISLVTMQATFPFLFGMSLGGVVYALYLLRKEKSKRSSVSSEVEHDDTAMHASDGNIFNLGPALRFAVLLTAIRVISNIAIVSVGSAGFIITSLLASLTGVDAVTITMGDLVNAGTITMNLGVAVFILINAVNLISKAVYSKISGSQGFFANFTWGVVTMLLSGIAFYAISIFM